MPTEAQAGQVLVWSAVQDGWGHTTLCMLLGERTAWSSKYHELNFFCLLIRSPSLPRGHLVHPPVPRLRVEAVVASPPPRIVVDAGGTDNSDGVACAAVASPPAVLPSPVRLCHSVGSVTVHTQTVMSTVSGRPQPSPQCEEICSSGGDRTASTQVFETQPGSTTAAQPRRSVPRNQMLNVPKLCSQNILI